MMSIINRMLALMTVALSGLVVAPGVAQAATGYDRCPPGYMCLFDDWDGQGAMAYFQAGSPDLALQNFDNRAQSQRNNNASNFCAYVNKKYDNSSGSGTYQPGTKGNFNANVNAYSSLRKC
ncbi:peptidase inhibitor family I36 protein [Amycolatopsis sp. cmx-11-12]|uniref:peptidase inhibitor family I36 protein n=1 Tax=Amycolatopsis sp. cmx-11-12 TaxID=2785795 RepID=UPI003918040C